MVALRRDDIDADRRFSEYHLGALSAPVGNESCVLVAAPEQHRVIAVDPKHGKQQWSFHAGGKVDSPPTIAGSLAVFGCADGCVYALRLTDGELAWRFRAAPSTAVGMLHGHFASAFPLPGSVLVLGRNVIAVAGHHTDLGGLHCWVLDLATGQPRAERVIAADQPRVVTNGVAVADADGNGFWIGKQLHLSLALEDLAVDWYQGPNPPIAFDRNGTRMRFRTDEGRGGSTHGWKGAMSIPGRNRLLRGHRLVAADKMAFGLIDPGRRNQQSPIVWATQIADADRAASWYQTADGLGGHESYGALAAAGEYVFIGGGNRDGSRGVVHVLNAATGQLVVTHDLPGRVAECGLAIADNRLFVSCENGTLASFSGNASR